MRATLQKLLSLANWLGFLLERVIDFLFGVFSLPFRVPKKDVPLQQKAPLAEALPLSTVPSHTAESQGVKYILPPDIL